MSFEKWFGRLSSRVERYLFYLTLLFLALLIGVQILMTRGDIRYYLNRVENLEGVPFVPAIEDPHEENSRPVDGVILPHVYSITLKISSPQDTLKVLVNGEERALLAEQTVVLPVEPGDLLEIGGHTTEPGPAVITVIDTRGLKFPEVGYEIHAFGDNELIGWVIEENEG